MATIGFVFAYANSLGTGHSTGCPTIGGPEENLLAMQGQMSEASNQIFRQLNDADLKWGMVKNERGQLVELDEPVAMSVHLRRQTRGVIVQGIIVGSLTLTAGLLILLAVAMQKGIGDDGILVASSGYWYGVAEATIGGNVMFPNLMAMGLTGSWIVVRPVAMAALM